MWGEWARALADGDQAKVKAAREKLADWNESNPDTPIVITQQQIVRRMRELKKTRAERATKAAPKELRAKVEEALH